MVSVSQFDARAAKTIRTGGLRHAAVRLGQDGACMPLPEERVLGTARQVLVVGILAPMVPVRLIR
ncbi:MAG: hypothetical protein ABIN37_11810 [Burkholderiaceae bacterium]